MAGESAAGAPALAAPAGRWVRSFRWGLLALWGPGLVVMLADTDAGSLVTAAQSGAGWGYRMVLPQLLLVPVLFVVQEMTIRLGMATGQGHGALIRARFGHRWAVLSASTLFLSSVGALITEFAGIAGVGELFGVSRWVSVPVVTAFLLGLAVTGSYTRVERIGIALGLAELTFVAVMLLARPDLHAVAHGLSSMPVGDAQFRWLLAANVGAVIMPWMVFYQQGAVIEKRMRPSSLRKARVDTAVGAVVTQIVMIAVVVSLAATVGRSGGGSVANLRLDSVGQIAAALSPFLGATAAKVLVGLGLLGAALVAAIVCSLAGAWGLAEVFGWNHSLNRRPCRRNAKFYLTYAAAHVVGAVLVLASFDLVSLTVDVEVMNALLLPVVLGFLLALEATALPASWRMRGVRKYATWFMCGAVIAFGLYSLYAVVPRLR